MQQRAPLLCAALAAAVIAPSAYANTVVRFETVLGDVDILLYEDEAPGHVTNFLNYVNDGDYDNSLIHRVIGAVDSGAVQGGVFKLTGPPSDPSTEGVYVPRDPAITSEAGLSHVRGTIAMGLGNYTQDDQKAGIGVAGETNPNSATSSFFFNMSDNTTEFDGTYTVFGEVVSGLGVLTEITTLDRWNVGGLSLPGTGAEVPLLDSFTGEEDEEVENEAYVLINAAYALLAGDLNANGAFNDEDIELFNQVLRDPGAFKTDHDLSDETCLAVADMNDDGMIDALDIDPFRDAFPSSDVQDVQNIAAVPEPATLTLLALAPLALRRPRRH